MKKLSLLVIFLSAILLTGCNSNPTSEVINEAITEKVEENITEDITEDVTENMEQEPTIIPENAQAENNQSEKNKTLVVYFSRADENYSVGVVEKGNTAFLAEHIANYLNADSFEIKPVIPYPTSYDETTKQATQELNDNARPKYIGDVTNWSEYDTIFLGYPIWWGDLPMIVYTFIESHDFSGKTVYLFNTHEGSGISGTYNSLKNKLSTANVNTDGLPMRGQDARKDSAKGEVEKWLKGLGF